MIVNSFGSTQWRNRQIIEIWCAHPALLQGCHDACHTMLIAIGRGSNHLFAINIAGDFVSLETQLQVVPLSSSNALHLCAVKHIFATHFDVLTGKYECLLLSIAYQLLLVEFSTSYIKLAQPVLVYLQIVALGPNAIARAYIADTPHHSGLVLRIQQHIGTHLVVGPCLITNNRVMVPLGCPTERVLTNSLLQACARHATWCLAQLKASDDIGHIMRQIAPF